MSWLFPIQHRVVGITVDSMSFQKIDVSSEIEIPVGNHVGAFGTARRHDIHKGVDLYALPGTNVFAVEDGVVVDIRWFTGVQAGCPWWCDTKAISIEGNTGIIVYGEIMVEDSLCIGSKISTGDRLGEVARVLKKDKGRPTSMLHLALHHHNVLSNGVWELGSPQPVGLLDPTNRLIASIWGTP